MGGKDWKKLNKDADFKKTYVAQSGKIKETLKKLKVQFEGNLDEAEKKEAKDQSEYDALKDAKEGMLAEAEKAMVDMEAEGGARRKSKEDAKNEKDVLTKQKEDNVAFLDEIKTAAEEKEKEWDARKEMRTKEITAMSQAIAELASDEAKDTMAKSFNKFMFLQERSVGSAPQRRMQCAARVVSSLSSQSKQELLALLAVGDPEQV